MTHEAGESLRSGLSVYIGFIVMALWGGLVNYIAKVRRGDEIKFRVAELIGDMMIAGFAGMLAMFICEAYHVPLWITAACTGMAGHMGSRLIYQLESGLSRQITSHLGSRKVEGKKPEAKAEEERQISG